jgi:hypothetical protein
MKISPKQWTTALLVLGGLGFVTLVVLKVAMARSGAKNEVIPVDRLKNTRAPAAVASAPPAGPIDLLDLIRITEDSVAGTWGFFDRALVTPRTPRARLQIPCIPPEEYDLNLVVTRKDGTDSLNLGIVVGGRQAMIVLDGHNGIESWFSVAGTTGTGDNETRVATRIFKWGRPVPLTVSVRKGAVSVSSQGKPLLDWKGSPADLELHPEFRVLHDEALLIASWDTMFKIDEMTLQPVSGSPKLLR